MKTFVLSLLLLGLPAASGASRTWAADAPPSSEKGKVLILKNEYTMEGDIERLGNRYRVRRPVGETWVPAERVLSLVPSLPDAYAYLRRRINLEDPDERLRLARWCRASGLQEQALAELQAAATLRPDHTETRRLLQNWKQTPHTTTAPKSAVPSRTQPAALDMPPIEVTSESLGLFATRVQPILMNTCACCHATGRGGKFRLTQVYADGIGNRRTLEHNLAAVLGQVDLNHPEASRLLIKAVSDHAHTGRAPLRDRQIAPYRTLENWVKVTVASNPHLRASQPAAAAAPSPPPPVFGPPTEEPRRHGAEESQWGAEARLPAEPRSTPTARNEKTNPVPLPPPQPRPPAVAAPPAPPVAAAPPDPYDPEPFNKQMHPETNTPGPGK